MDAELKALHHLYNEIAILQQQLPQKFGKKDYSLVEEKIRLKAGELKLKCFSFIKSSTVNEKNEAVNIYEGALTIEKDPYKKIGGIVKLDN